MKIIIKIINFLLFTVVPAAVLAQGQIEGIVFDKNTGQRVAEVRISNISTGQSVYNNARGEFNLDVNKGDIVLAEKKGFDKDSITVDGNKVLLLYLERSMRYIPEVTVTAKQSPETILEQAKKDYKKAYDLAEPGSAFSVGPTGAGLNLNTIYNLFSKEGKNAKRLTKTIEKEYQENVIDSKFTASLVRNTTGLRDSVLHRFMQRYRPSYYFIISTNEYQLVEYIKNKYEMFKLTPELRNLPVLPRLELQEKTKNK
ncbi:MAG TPA: hypothetical protein VK102_02220 [Sphingobacterium sp.]|nr:hypothetical protein [Sphingobacterium sp.]